MGRALPEASRPHLHASSSQVAVDSWRTSLPEQPSPAPSFPSHSRPPGHRRLRALFRTSEAPVKTPLQPACPARVSVLPPAVSHRTPRPSPSTRCFPGPLPLPSPRWGKPPREAPASLSWVAPPAPARLLLPKGRGRG